jgi:glycosyltransferase involved in cell wall biosynthesis
LHREKFDLIHAHGSQDLWNSAAARRMGHHSLPLIFTRHHTKKLVDHAFNRFLYRKVVDHLIVACASVLDRYRPFLERGDITEDRISVIHSAYREDRFHPGVDGSAIRHELGAGPETMLVGVVGRLQPEKGGMYFLRAAAKIAPAFPTARFVFVGRGSDEMLLRQTAAELGIAERVIFMGFREDIPEITAALDLSVLPSIDCDASSAVLKEAMAMGRPVVATIIGGAGDIVEADKTGLLVPHADPEALATAIGTILGMPDRGRAMGERGQQRVVAHFTRERLVEQTLATYRKVLERWQQHQQGNNR